MAIGAIISGVFAVAFTLGALALPFGMYKWVVAQPSPWRRLGGALYALFGTMGAGFFAVLSTGFMFAYLEITGSTFWTTFLIQAGVIGANLFFWFSRLPQASN